MLKFRALALPSSHSPPVLKVGGVVVTFTPEVPSLPNSTVCNALLCQTQVVCIPLGNPHHRFFCVTVIQETDLSYQSCFHDRQIKFVGEGGRTFALHFRQMKSIQVLNRAFSCESSPSRIQRKKKKNCHHVGVDSSLLMVILANGEIYCIEIP